MLLTARRLDFSAPPTQKCRTNRKGLRTTTRTPEQSNLWRTMNFAPSYSLIGFSVPKVKANSTFIWHTTRMMLLA